MRKGKKSFNVQFLRWWVRDRRLTPIECERLQGFPDNWNEKGIVNGETIKMSDTQRYRQAGNAVTVPIVKMIAEKIKKEIFNES